MQSKEHGGDTRVTQVDVISLLTSLGWTPMTCLFFFFFSFLERPHLFSNSIQSIYCSLCWALCPLDVSALLWALLHVLWKQGQTICIGEMRLLYCHFCFNGLSFVSQGFQVGHHSLLSSPQMLAGYVDPTLLWLIDFTTHGNVVGSP